MDESAGVRQAALEVAAAIERRDVRALAGALAPGFVHRTLDGESRDADVFLKGIVDIPGEIVFVRLVGLEVDVAGAGALATGIQHAQVRIDGQEIDDRRAFVDWFITDDGRWKIRVAVDLPVPAPVS
jgi:ketosteroid isomerase-like protein